MGVKIFDIVPARGISWKELEGKTLAVDASLFLYQFLSSIRQRDGSLLVDSKGRVTSHLVGLFSRTVNWLEKGIKPVFVFDGAPPELKRNVLEARSKVKAAAEEKYSVAVKEGDVEEMRKFASRTSKLSSEMVEEAKELLQALGLPIIQAPSEAEAQAAFLTMRGDAWAVASQDADCLLFGAERLVRNLSITGRRKKVGKFSYETVLPEILSLKDVLNSLGIDRDRLIALSMLVGTDYAPSGVKGIGSKTALKIVKTAPSLDSLFSDVRWAEHCETSWEEIFSAFKNVPVTKEYDLKFLSVDASRVKRLLVERHEFSESRVMESLQKVNAGIGQKGLGDFLQ